MRKSALILRIPPAQHLGTPLLSAVIPFIIFTQVCSERQVVSKPIHSSSYQIVSTSSQFERCFELSDRSCLLSQLEDSNQQPLLNEVLDTIFVPEGFKESCILATNTEKFSEYDLNMIVRFLTYLEFFHEVSDAVLQLNTILRTVYYYAYEISCAKHPRYNALLVCYSPLMALVHFNATYTVILRVILTLTNARG